MNIRKIQLLLLGLLSAPLLNAAPLIEVDCSRTEGRVNRLNFGQNIETADTRGIFGPRVGSPEWNRHDVRYGQGLWDPETGKPAAGSADVLRALNSGSLRYPGGCLAHNFNWKQAVGPLEGRPDWKFGLDQYLELCRELKLEPVITLTDYALPAEELPQHLAELVEYLNAPAAKEHPWALKRAQWGHPEPYKVRYFELGNESYHGNHNGVPRRRFSAEEYVRYAVSCAEAIRRVDPSVQLGIVMYHEDWNRTVLKGTGRIADFAVVHYYGPAIMNSGPEASLRAVLAYPDQLEKRMAGHRELIRECTGRELPLMVTEYNVASSKSKPFLHRFSYLAGLMNADLMRLWQKPGSRVIAAHYWHLLNGAWGMFNTPEDSGEVVERHATMPFFELWGRFRADSLLPVRISGNPRVAAPPLGGLLESCGEEPQGPRPLKTVDAFQFNFKPFEARPEISAAAAGADGLDITVDRARKEAYLPFAVVRRPAEVKKGHGYDSTVSFEARITGASGSASVGLGFSDIRGWADTNSAGMSTPVPADGKFHRLEFTLNALPDCPGKELLLRLEQIGKPFSGKVEIRNLRVAESFSATAPAYPALTALAGLSGDRKKLYLVVFNRHPEQAIEAPVTVSGAAATSCRSYELSCDRPESTGYFEAKSGTVPLEKGTFRRTFPRHSMTLFEFDMKH